MNESEKYRIDPKKAEAPSPAANFLLISAGSIFTSTVIAGFLVGYFIDYLLGTMPIFFLACGVLGFVGGMQKVVHLTKRLDNTGTPEKSDDQKTG
ncbi:MAG: ATP synthase protein I [Thiomicrorhabdus sp.]|nr:MAG: ATP synthase protein I [Thiomicrorhabdus sp.]